MRPKLTASRLANLGANVVFEAFIGYQNQFNGITQRAKNRFESRDWHGLQADATERLDLYRKMIKETVAEIHHLLNEQVTDTLVWVSLKAVYSGLIADRDDWELAETWFNSVTRQIFTTVGVDPRVEFVDTDFETPPTRTKAPFYRTYPQMTTKKLVRKILCDFAFGVEYQDCERDADLLVERIEEQLRAMAALRIVERTDIVTSIFYRGKGAYIVGRMYSGAQIIPLVLALVHTANGIVVDAVLMDEDDVSVLFSFTRSYFHVEVERPYDLVHFLKSIMPRKRIAELYIAIGYNKHGKTEMYRDLLRHLSLSDDRFEIAKGERGMVMVVFTLPTYDMVFKMIKDHFAYPKRTTRQEVMSKYRLVFKHDKAGRLVDAQEYEHLQFHRHRFTPECLAELQEVAAQSVVVDDEYVIIKHAYVERRLSPLNIYAREANDEAARHAVIDYGNAVKDMIKTNIFPGDLLLKNFGVTRHGRVVFYDYDELTLLTDCRFRKMPQARNLEDELFAEGWFTPGENDIFPEEFAHFLGLPDDLHAVFVEHHADLFDYKYWRGIQRRLKDGELIHIFPYSRRLRLNQDEQHLL
ncbi:MAG: bifunctional isocitrate dehydrogenase kinase/phosphatase [Anaerolineae bacterium]